MLLLLVVYTELTFSDVQYYITPNDIVKRPCPKNCLTLSQFADITSRLNNNVSLLFLPGNHTLLKVLSVENLNDFSAMKYEKEKGEVFVKCDGIGRFIMSKIALVLVKGFHFFGCGENRVNEVDYFVLETSTFQSTEDRRTVLFLDEAKMARISNSSFFSNDNVGDPENLGIDHIAEIVDHIDEESRTYTIGGVIYAAFSNVLIVNSEFNNNTADVGGVVFAYQSSVHILSSSFTNNKALDGGVIATFNCSVTIERAFFNENEAEYFAGVLASYNDLYVIKSSVFSENYAGIENGVIEGERSEFGITNSSFTSNKADERSGVLFMSDCHLNISFTSFTNNAACVAGVLDVYSSSLEITDCRFSNNNSTLVAVLQLYHSTVRIYSSAFFNNYASGDSGVIWCSSGLLTLLNSTFENNGADKFGGVMTISDSAVNVIDCSFDNNIGSIYTISSEVIFDGNCKIQHSAKMKNKSTSKDQLVLAEGGALTVLQSTVIFNGLSSLTNNEAENGGAILAHGSKIVLNGDISIERNSASHGNGGGISLYQSTFEIKGNCTVFNNKAMNGGGIYASSSYLSVFQDDGILYLTKNSAINGGGMYLQTNPNLYLMKYTTYSVESMLRLSGNEAHYGGGIYVDDSSNSEACLSITGCFIQVLWTDPSIIDFNKTKDIIFSKNTAADKGQNLFGGLLDRCYLFSPFSDIFLGEWKENNGVTYIQKISNISLESMASFPVKVCFCTDESEHDCDYQPKEIRVKKGESFNIFVVAVDQVNSFVAANIISSVTSKDGGLREGQQIQSVKRSCTELVFNVFSPHNLETLSFYADGPCGHSETSVKKIDIQFLNCTCSIGFVPSNDKTTTCECICDPELSQYVSGCNSTTETLLLRENNTAWINYFNTSDNSGYIIYQNCPLDYCYANFETISINLNIPGGSDGQCAYNRTGKLCGVCKQNYSLSLGSSHCVPCHRDWPIKLVAISIAAIMAGIILVSLMIVLNMTVSIGLINGFIFYSNIISSMSATLYPSSSLSYSAMFVAWLNLDIGIDVCFFDGLDTYTKIWLQLSFPVYIISLVVVIIIVSEYSSKFSRLIGKADPVATLATLILLSYAKLLSLTIKILSFAVLNYPDGSQEILWRFDGNVKYFKGKHIVLGIVSLLIILIGIPYTVILFFWQWIVGASKYKLFEWTRNTKLNAFITAYHAPYNSKHRYWTGLLLIVRVVLYITASVTVSTSPQTIPLLVIILVGGILVLKASFNARVYKKTFVDIIETLLYFNVLAPAAFSIYDFKTNINTQTAVAYTSIFITIILLVGVIAYHIFLLVEKKKSSKPTPEYSPPQSPPKSAVTHSVIEIPMVLQNQHQNFINKDSEVISCS